MKAVATGSHSTARSTTTDRYGSGCSFMGMSSKRESDTEVLLRAYAQWGRECLAQLNGMFAFAIWDRRERCLFAARDRLGIKPFYWASRGSALLFASEIKSTIGVSGLVEVAADNETEMNPWHFPSAPRTGFEGNQKLPAGHTLEWRDGQVSVKPWWQVTIGSDDSESRVLEEELADLLASALDLQMISDVPIGALLSGGLDSSLVVALMRRRTTSSVRTFTIGFRDEDRRFESMSRDDLYARGIAARLGCQHSEIVITPDVLSLLPELVWHMDEPIADPAAINTALISRAARDAGVVVLLNGMGADEIFGGYRKHMACLLADSYRALLPSWLRSLAESAGQRISVAGAASGYRRRRWLRRFLGFASLDRIPRFLQSDLSIDPGLYARLFERSHEMPYTALQEVAHRCVPFSGRGVSYLQQMCLSDTTIFLPDHNLTYTDKASMAAGVEGRPPIIDHRIVEFAFRLADRERIHRSTQKAILRRVAGRWLPAEVLRRPKAPFGAPLRSWIRGALAPMVSEYLSERSMKQRGVLVPSVLLRKIQADRAGAEDHSHLIWTLLSRETWYREFIDAAGRRVRDAAALRSSAREIEWMGAFSRGS
ncbi:MAG: asparagine synthase (glutamine-hydrolyzing) [Acidobacteriota bacterium]